MCITFLVDATFLRPDGSAKIMNDDECSCKREVVFGALGGGDFVFFLCGC